MRTMLKTSKNINAVNVADLKSSRAGMCGSPSTSMPQWGGEVATRLNINLAGRRSLVALPQPQPRPWAIGVPSLRRVLHHPNGWLPELTCCEA